MVGPVGQVVYEPSSQDSAADRAVLAAMVPLAGYLTVAGHVIDGVALDSERDGQISAEQLAGRLAGMDPSRVAPVVMAACRSAELGAVMVRAVDAGGHGLRRAVWASPHDVAYRRGALEAGTFALRASGPRFVADGSWRLFLPVSDVDAAAALWPGGEAPSGSASVAQWRWLGERGLYQLQGRVGVPGWSALTPQEVADEAASGVAGPVVVLDVNGGVARAGAGGGDPIVLLVLADGGVAPTAPYAAELLRVLGEQAPVGLRSGAAPSRPGGVVDRSIRLYKPRVALYRVLKAVTAAMLAAQAGSRVGAVPVPRGGAGLTAVRTGGPFTAGRELVVYYHTQNWTGQYVSPTPLSAEGVTSVHVGTFKFDVNTTAFDHENATGLNPQLSLNGLPLNHSSHTVMWKDLQTLQKFGVEVVFTLGGPGHSGRT